MSELVTQSLRFLKLCGHSATPLDAPRVQDYDLVLIAFCVPGHICTPRLDRGRNAYFPRGCTLESREELQNTPAPDSNPRQYGQECGPAIGFFFKLPR